MARWIIGLAAFAAFALVSAEVPSARQTELMHFLRHDCGSCHGMRLTGGLGPPLTPAALADKPAAALTATILYGRPGTPMAPWARFVSEDEARWLVDIMKRGAADDDSKQ
jgi:cytochrome c55X